ncbi:tyrosine-type recombinase/integrase [Helicobacter hepaticus]|mgnify:CR=1 FL=1|jgi:integrase|uniref:Integrase n=1 Tax=Helicobacter hepaticus (strain ATCC 51449 / 3B1) TaxID=235279 RepID=Q7VJH4_HELHP|nr:integrase [Helicobacter hepaticus ATCC 51449]
MIQKKEIVSSLHIRDIHHSQISKIIMQLQLRIPEGAKRLLAHCYNIWQFALSRGLAEFNIIANIDKKTILLPKSDRHYAKITDRVVLGELMRAIDSYPNSIIIKCALQFVAIIPLRASNLALLKWEYIDFESKTLTIPRGNMKVKSNHLTDFTLPLPRQAIEILQEIKQFTGWGKLVFHASTKIHSPLVMESLNKALRSMGFADEKRGRKQTIHSFRGTFRSLCNTYQSEHNASFEIKEAVLDHKVGNRVTEAYLYKVEYVEQIRPLLQWWADFLDRVREE